MAKYIRLWKLHSCIKPLILHHRSRVSVKGKVYTPAEGTLLLKTTDSAPQNKGECTRQLKQDKVCLWRCLALFDCNCSFPVIADYI